MRGLFLLLFGLCMVSSKAQELYVNTEPASNMAAKSIGLRLAGRTWDRSPRLKSRLTPEIMLGISKKVMVHVEGSIADYYSDQVKPESINLYGKYRFVSMDGVQTHFRMAAYSRVSYSRNSGPFDDLNLEGDVSGFSSGIVVTQLLHKLALSSTLGFARAVRTGDGLSAWNGEAFNYSLSAGYLLLPRSYTSYDQLNVNLYLELLGKTNPTIRESGALLLQGGNSLALAPALQFIISSQTRIDAGVRFDLQNTGTSMGTVALLRIEYNLFNAW